MQSIETGTPILLSASGVIGPARGALLGFYVNSTSSGTIVLRDGGAQGTAVTGTITPAIGFHRFPANFTTGCYATIGGTLSVTFLFVSMQ